MIRVPDVVRCSAERYPEAAALASAGRPSESWSFAQLRILQERGADVLQAAQLVPGDRVLLYLEPCAAWPVALFSVLEAGLVAVPIVAETSNATAAGIAAFAGARTAILGNRTRDFARLANGIHCLNVEQLLEPDSPVLYFPRFSYNTSLTSGN